MICSESQRHFDRESEWHFYLMSETQNNGGTLTIFRKE